MKSIELFAGIGGIALAAEWAGIETVAFCEREPFCQKVLSKNFPGVPIFDDVRTLNRQLLEEKGVIEPGGTIDIISGGFPCQPYSIAGKRRGTEDDRDLWPEMFRIIKELRPTWVVGENVANFANMELDRTLFDLESAGYKGQSFIIPACAVDAKHRRDRTFVVAYSDHKRQQTWGCEKSSGGAFISRFSVMANTDSERLQRTGTKQQTAGSAGKSEAISHTDSKGLERTNRPELESSDVTRCSTLADSENKRDVRRHRIISDNDGSTGKGSYYRTGTETDDSWQRWPAEPDVGRVAHGVPNRVDRIKGLGNAVVPQQIYPIFKAIMDQEAAS
ncbi:DNA (cytosine-5-)-methyltransferase [Bacillus inaquosorum]|uniref:DNA cytosine methyltransferase n=1 Tax=Bacillus inaquosorum TaxID=483913 RepID=UPI00227E7F33|nr:DNA (cytosine-5-)-methyltransferase [Bacillus inaquosorum]MCY8247480.1 DNA (cytosine-5-)-methyltransferase [Bacillus inaquosorum]MCY8251566.1 DNA (cytosine-5-)-methyltransferase [Bacillus inaquosorum]MEC0585242.1 DNA (cytosine-5-)-methyltransferase [Bacillus spizizenii]